MRRLAAQVPLGPNRALHSIRSSRPRRYSWLYPAAEKRLADDYRSITRHRLVRDRHRRRIDRDGWRRIDDTRPGPVLRGGSTHRRIVGSCGQRSDEARWLVCTSAARHSLQLVKWLCLGSVPGAFSGVLLARSLGRGEDIQNLIRTALGVALLLAAAGLIVRAYLRLVEHARQRDGRAEPLPQGRPQVQLRHVPTVLLGLLGGIVVGLTSVGSGSLIIIALMGLYPTLKASELVGTDLVQAVPLVAAAALGHIFFGDFQLELTTSLLLGCIPGVWLGAQLSARASGGLVRRALAFVLLASALKLLNVSTAHTGIILALILVLAPLAWMLVRRRHGFPAFARSRR